MSIPPTEFDLAMMRRAIALAMRGRGYVEPNPMVGCVIVKDGRVIGEGYHERFGGPHAEPNALANCAESPAGATAYVTLEPCCHTNKKTPPCAPAVIAAGLKRVVVGALDPNPAVNGKGLAMLRKAGIEVTAPVLEGEAKQLIVRFLARVTLDRPYVTMKWAQTADGKVAGPGGKRLQITNERSRQLVHELRSRCDSILVGIGTVLADDPRLDARYATRPRHPQRYVLDRDLRTPINAKIVVDEGGPTNIFCRHSTDGGYRHRRDALQEEGVNTTIVPTDAAGMLRLPDALRRMKAFFCEETLVEPGPALAASFFRENLVDRLWVFRSTAAVKDATAPVAVPVPAGYVETGRLDLDGDDLTEYLNPASPAFFAPVASADLRMAEVSA